MSFYKNLIFGAAAIALLTACGGNEPEGPSQTETVEAQKPATTVKLSDVTTQNLQSWVFGEGTARAVQREFLSFESAGRIAYLDPKLKEGDPVKKGQIIAYQQQDRAKAEVSGAQAQLSDSLTQVTVAEATRMEAMANLELAQKTFERFEILLGQRSASQQEYDEAAAKLAQAKAAMLKAERQAEAAGVQVTAARAKLGTAEVTAGESRIEAPIDGVIARLNIEQGFYFSPQVVQTSSEQAALDTVPVVIIDPSAYEISVNIPSYESYQIKVGADVLIEPASAGGRPEADAAAGPTRAAAAYAVTGEIYSVSPSFDPATRTFHVKIRTNKGAERLRDGEFVTVWIGGAEAEQALTIPDGTARFADGEAFVFVYEPATQTVKRQPVLLGLQGSGRNQVILGLQAGQQVVHEGRSKLSDGDKVRVIRGTGT